MKQDPRWELQKRVLRVTSLRLEPLDDLLEPIEDTLLAFGRALPAAILSAPILENQLDPAVERLFLDLGDATASSLVALAVCQRLEKQKPQGIDTASTLSSCRALLADLERFLIDLEKKCGPITRRLVFPLSLLISSPGNWWPELLAKPCLPTTPSPHWPAMRDRAERLIARAGPWRHQPAIVSDQLLMAEIMASCPAAAETLKSMGLRCLGCVVSTRETLREAADYYPFRKEDLLSRLKIQV